MKLGDIGEEMVATAIALAKERGAEIEAITVVRVPRKFALEGQLPPDVAARVDASLEEARALGEDHGVEVHGDVVRARSIGHAIVDEARARDADLIVMGSSPRWRRQSRFFSPTVDFVLRKRAVRGSRRRLPRGRLRGVGCAAVKAVVIGCGRVGSAVAKGLAADGWDVTVVDENEDALVAPRPGLARRLRRRSRHGRHACSSGPASGTPTRRSSRRTATTRTSSSARCCRSATRSTRVVVRILDPARAKLYSRPRHEHRLPDADRDLGRSSTPCARRRPKRRAV